MSAYGFGHVRDYVLGQIGGTRPDEARLRILMQAGLVQVASRLRFLDEVRLTADIDLTKDVDTYDKPVGASRIVSVKIGPWVIYPAQKARVEYTVDDRPHSYRVDGEKIIFAAAPGADMTAKVTYIADVDTTLYDLDELDQIVWRYVPFPDQIVPAYMELVLGRALEMSDPGLAAMKVNSAMSQIEEWRITQNLSHSQNIQLNGAALNSRRRDRFNRSWENDPARFVGGN